jgi:hypothetical protein
LNRIEMVNIALTAIGSSRITDLDDTTKEEARVMKSLYLPTVEEVLSLYPWPSATKRARLAQVTNGAELTKWDYAYQIPNDVVWIISMLDPDTFEEMDYIKGSSRPSPITVPIFEREGSLLYTNSDECIIMYVKLPTEPDGLRDIIGEVIGLRLAQKAAVRIGRDVQIKMALEQEFERMLLRAKAADTVDWKLQPIETKTWGDYR